MKYLILCHFVLFASSYSIAQKNFQSGSLLLEDGTSLPGWIDYRNWSTNPKYIDFKHDSLSNAITRFYIKDLQSFVIGGKDAYQRAIVSKDMRPVKANALANHTQDIQVTDTVLLRILVKSPKLSLFELVDAKKHFFITDGNGEIKELQYKVYKTEGSSTLRSVEIYKDQLKSLAFRIPQPEKIIKKIARTPYKAEELANIVLMLNGDANDIAFTASPSRIRSQVFAGAGIEYSTIKFKGYDNFRYVQFSGNIYPSVTLGIDIFSERNLQAYLLRFELSFRKAKYSGTGYREYNSAGFKEDVTYYISQNTIAPGFDFLYKFRNAKKLSLYGGVGASYNLSAYSENKYITYNPLSGRTTEQDDYIPFQRAWLSGKLMAGAIINKKIEVGAAANLIGSFATGYNLKYSAVSLNVGYRF